LEQWSDLCIAVFENIRYTKPIAMTSR